MKKTLALAGLSMLGGMFATPALAQDQQAPAAPAAPTAANDHSGFYAGAGINVYFVNKGDAAQGMPIEFVDQPSPAAFVGRLGYAFNDYVALEVEAGFGGAHQKFEGSGINAELGIETPLSAHVVGTMPYGQGGGYLLGKIGYASAKLTRELNGAGFEDLTLGGVSLGIGGGVRSDRWDLRLEYSFISGGDANSGVLGMTALRRF